MKEEYKHLNGYEGIYVIYPNGDIIASRRQGSKGGKMRTYTDKTGYRQVRLCKNGRGKLKYVHRLIAQHFIPNPENKPCINHKDGDKLNNSIDNLEWCTYSENLVHAIQTELRQTISEKMKNKVCVGIDPGVNTGLFACVGNEILFKQTISPFDIVKKIKDIEDNFGKIKHIYVEDPNFNKPVFSRNVRGAQMMRIAQNVGSNKRDAQWIIALLEKERYKIIPVQPTSKKWTDKEYKLITGDTGRTSQHIRDAAKLVFGR